MKAKPFLIIGIAIFLIGAMMLIWRESFASGAVVKFCGILFLLAGLINWGLNLSTYAKTKHEDAEAVQLQTKGERVKHLLAFVVSDAAIVLGIVLLAFYGTFVPYIPVTFGVFALVGAIMMFYTLAIGIRPIMLPGWLYAFPVLILIASVFIYFQKTPDDDATVMAMAGYAACLYGLGSIIIATKIASINRAAAKAVGKSTEIKSLDEQK
jgi:MFS family permease